MLSGCIVLYIGVFVILPNKNEVQISLENDHTVDSSSTLKWFGLGVPNKLADWCIFCLLLLHVILATECKFQQ